MSVDQQAVVLPSEQPRADRRSRFWLGALVVFALATALRLLLVAFSKGGPGGNFGYDAGVYYAAADALIHGRLPYHDFLLLHPPGVMLTLTPVAGLGQLVGDHTAFMVGNGLFSALGGGSAVLVMAISRRMGLSRGAAVVGGLFYAVWLGAIFSEISARLEPLGSFAFLLGLFGLTGPRGRRGLILGGVALGFSATVKIWWILPVLIVLIWQYFVRPRRDALRATAGTALALVVVNGPFFVIAPSRMWRMLVTDQFGRPANSVSREKRIGYISSINDVYPKLHRPAELAIAVVVLVLSVLLAALAWRRRAARVAIAVAIFDALVLFLIPVYNNYYSGFVAAGLAILVAAAFDRGHGRFSIVRPALAGVTTVLALLLSLVAIFDRKVSVTQPFPQGIGPHVKHIRCITADAPIGLIEIDALSRGLADSKCANWVDVTGHTYDDLRSTSKHKGRSANKPWQKGIRRYLLSGQAFVVVRNATGLNAKSKELLNSYPVVYRQGPVVIRRVVP